MHVIHIIWCDINSDFREREAGVIWSRFLHKKMFLLLAVVSIVAVLLMIHMPFKNVKNQIHSF